MKQIFRDNNSMLVQMQRHADKLQRAKEEAALKAMRRLLPDMSPGVWILALQECDWDVENATILLNTFKAVKADDLQQIQDVSLYAIQYIDVQRNTITQQENC